MSEPMTAQSLADTARRLAALARAKSQTAENTADQVRFGDQVRKLDVELGQLKSALAVHDRLAGAGVPVSDLPDLQAEPRELRRQVTTIGRPTWQYIQARVKSVANKHSMVTESDTAAWMGWAQSQVAALPLTLVPRLGFERGATESRVKQLRSFAAAAPSLGNIGQFRALLYRVADDLAKVETAGVDSVLGRFVQGRILLADLSDEELALLRSESSLRDQLYLSLS